MTTITTTSRSDHGQSPLQGTEATPQMIAARLKKLEADRLVKAPLLRHEYRLTEKGEAFHPVVLALRGWGKSY